MGKQAEQGYGQSSWAPMAVPAFRLLWLAQMVSNIGTWMQTVGAQWMLVHQHNAALLTSAVQAASLLPVLFVSLPAGVLADLLDRRHILLGLSTAMAVLAGVLAGLTGAGLATPTVLLLLTFLMGCGQAMTNPAWQAIQPELVPRDLIPQAASLNSLNVNVARAVGPALAGLLVAVSGPAVVFTVNAVSFVVVALAVYAWHRPAQGLRGSEAPVPALHAGVRYVRHAPGVRRILVRSALFVLPASALWALLPVTAGRSLHLGSGGYGLLLGALGVGAIVGALTIKRLRAAVSDNVLLALGGVMFAGGTVAAATLHSLPALALVLLPTGAAWLVNLSTFNTELQLRLPGWVRARGLAVYLIVFMGGQGIGSLVWGAVAGAAGLTQALLAAAGLLVATTVTLLWWPVIHTAVPLDRSVVSTWPEPALLLDAVPEDTPVLVLLDYTVAPEDADAFVAGMRPVEQSRRRTGAVSWDLYRDSAAPERFTEAFQVASWSEHLLQHDGRTTGYDERLLQDVRSLAQGPPTVRHLLPSASRPATEGAVESEGGTDQ
ncbi:MFS transporter [Streptacidiphilus sp. MAP5-3]|uniref:MFS transporter n=1 Tax=unclassified Streptacidiphilus TaxID=2643834 RepID=UPI0035196E95